MPFDATPEQNIESRANSSVSTEDYLRKQPNAKVARTLEYLASMMQSSLTGAILKEAAKRLGSQSDPFFATPPKPELPPLETAAVPESEATPFGLTVDSIARQAIEKIAAEPWPRRGYLIVPAHLLDDQGT